MMFQKKKKKKERITGDGGCLLYTSDAADETSTV